MSSGLSVLAAIELFAACVPLLQQSNANLNDVAEGGAGICWRKDESPVSTLRNRPRKRRRRPPVARRTRSGPSGERQFSRRTRQNSLRKIKTLLALTILAKRYTQPYGNWSRTLSTLRSPSKCCPAYRLR